MKCKKENEKMRNRLCLCRDCIKNNIECSCGCASCKGKVNTCKSYKGYEQMQFFNNISDKHKNSPKKSWKDYGISKERYNELKEAVRSGKYMSIAEKSAVEANEYIAQYILLSVTQNKSYEDLQIKWELREIERMACCRTDFYGYRRLFYSLFDKELRNLNKN